ncbi:MAG: amidohydrolase family protein, partial [Gemmatimonadaceae bacterium]|nr:amidohydrolase family protein [Chitinophagaceae bacterium]
MKKIFILATAFLATCLLQAQTPVDLLIHNANIYTVDDKFSKFNAMAVKDGKIVATGNGNAFLKAYAAKETIDAGGKFVYPGLIDAHAHFFGYASGLLSANLVGTDSWEQIVEKIKEFGKGKTGWIVGRGWDQNDWKNKNFPDNEMLNAAFPDRPVMLVRVDGHAAIVNQKAMDLAGVKPGDTLTGGEVETK